ncbi:hypothetical protein HanIR_Chr16g0835331 [Helianthus annuus]|nr:hypothetical protein HanIR_Chr16g0835331 [Helianthus annuus]
MRHVNSPLKSLFCTQTLASLHSHNYFFIKKEEKYMIGGKGWTHINNQSPPLSLLSLNR